MTPSPMPNFIEEYILLFLFLVGIQYLLNEKEGWEALMFFFVPILVLIFVNS